METEGQIAATLGSGPRARLPGALLPVSEEPQTVTTETPNRDCGPNGDSSGRVSRLRKRGSSITRGTYALIATQNVGRDCSPRTTTRPRTASRTPPVPTGGLRLAATPRPFLSPPPFPPPLPFLSPPPFPPPLPFLSPPPFPPPLPFPSPPPFPPPWPPLFPAPFGVEKHLAQRDGISCRAHPMTRLVTEVPPRERSHVGAVTKFEALFFSLLIRGSRGPPRLR